MLSTSATVADATPFVTAVKQAGGRVPEVLTSILAGAGLPDAAHAPSDPAQAIVKAAAGGTLTAVRLTDLITEAAHTAMVATYTRETRRRVAPPLVTAFYEALQSGAGDES